MRANERVETVCFFLCGQRELYREDARIVFNGKFQSENSFTEIMLLAL